MLQRPRTALLGALGCTAGLVATGLVSHLSPTARRVDAEVLESFTRVRAHDVDGVLAMAVHFADPVPYLLMGAVIVAAALAAGRTRRAAMVAAVLLLAPFSAEVIKVLTAQARTHSVPFTDHVADASWPSGHATGAMTLALCAVLVAPSQLRVLVAAAGAVYALVIGYAVIALVWHFPSDTVGAYLLSAAWAMVAVAATRRWPDPVREPRRAVPRGAVALATAGLVTSAAVAFGERRPNAVLDRVADHPQFVVAAAAIAGLAAVLATLLVRSARTD